jgi:hypothetical protein
LLAKTFKKKSEKKRCDVKFPQTKQKYATWNEHFRRSLLASQPKMGSTKLPTNAQYCCQLIQQRPLIKEGSAGRKDKERGANTRARTPMKLSQ